MAAGNLYQIDGTAGIRRLSPSAPASEDEMQKLVASFPELISDAAGELLLIKREQSVADSLDGPGRWSIDHLFVTRLGIPVLVEIKRAVDTRLRREVVGQMLEYAANASAYWQPGMLAASFAATCEVLNIDSEKTLASFIGSSETSGFWDQVGSNLRSGRMKLFFVADVIPRELARIVEFMNDQMEADVRAVELRWYTGEDGRQTLSPRVIGETERSAASKPARRGALPPVTIDEWVAAKIAPFGEKSVKASSIFRDIIQRAGGVVETPTTQGSIYGCFVSANGRKFYPFHLWPAKVTTVSLSLSYLSNHPAFASETVRQSLLHDAASRLGPLSSNNINGFPAFPAELLLDERYATAFSNLLAKVLEVANAGTP